jgi:Fur family transcriptional regulator, ferric uptake regulator
LRWVAYQITDRKQYTKFNRNLISTTRFSALEITTIIAQTTRLTIVKPLNSTENLKTSGLKATLPRLRVLELFEKSAVRHLSAEDVYKLLQKDGTDTGLATVYRVLTQFEQAGLLIRHHFESDKAVFELNQGVHHDHLVCVQCGHVEEFYDAEIEKRQSDVAAARGFRIHDHSLHIYADCLRGDCPRKNVSR